MSQMNRRRALQLLAALGTTGLAAACGTDDADAQPAVERSPIKIGLIAPQTGGLKAIGDDIANGFQLFLDLQRQAAGRAPDDLLTADEGDTAKTGKAAVDGLLKQGVLALTGVVNSAVMVRHPGHRGAGPGAADRLQRLPDQPPERRLHLADVVRAGRAGPGAGPLPARTAARRQPARHHRAGEHRQPGRGRGFRDGVRRDRPRIIGAR